MGGLPASGLEVEPLRLVLSQHGAAGDEGGGSEQNDGCAEQAHGVPPA